jgi:hypothetical protein
MALSTTIQQKLSDTLEEAAGLAFGVHFDTNDRLDLDCTFKFNPHVANQNLQAFTTNAIWVSHLFDAQDALRENYTPQTIERGLKLVCLFLAELGSIQASTYHQEYTATVPVSKYQEIVDFCAQRTQELNNLMPKQLGLS